MTNVLHKLIYFCFEGSDNTYLSVTKYGAKWFHTCLAILIYLIRKRLKNCSNIC